MATARIDKAAPAARTQSSTSAPQHQSASSHADVHAFAGQLKAQAAPTDRPTVPGAIAQGESERAGIGQAAAQKHVTIIKQGDYARNMFPGKNWIDDSGRNGTNLQQALRHDIVDGATAGRDAGSYLKEAINLTRAGYALGPV